VYNCLEGENIEDPIVRADHLKYIDDIKGEKDTITQTAATVYAPRSILSSKRVVKYPPYAKWVVALLISFLFFARSLPPKKEDTQTPTLQSQQTLGGTTALPLVPSSGGSVKPTTDVPQSSANIVNTPSVTQNPTPSASSQSKQPTETSPTKQKTFFLGADEEAVKAALGNPGKVDQISSGYRWSYGLGSVTFGSNGQVTGWYNYNGVLNAGMIKKMDNAPPIFLGSTKDDVLKVLGAPGQIDSSNQNKWQYGLGYITLALAGRLLVGTTIMVC